MLKQRWGEQVSAPFYAHASVMNRNGWLFRLRQYGLLWRRLMLPLPKVASAAQAR
jgi:hypothetical protein